MKKTNKGFTLIELMIGIAIIGTIAAIAIPKYVSMIQKAREGATKGNLGVARSTISIYYGANEGMFPYHLTGNPPTDPLYEGGGFADQKWGQANGSPDGMYARGWSEMICHDLERFVKEIPENKISPGSNKRVRSGVWNEPDTNVLPSGNNDGWFYCFRNGSIIVNNNGTDLKGISYTIW